MEVIAEDVGKEFRGRGGEGKTSCGLEINRRVKDGGLFIDLPLLRFPSGRKAQGTMREELPEPVRSGSIWHKEWTMASLRMRLTDATHTPL